METARRPAAGPSGSAGGPGPSAAIRHPVLVDAALAAVTVVGVLAGTALVDGRVDYAGAVPLAWYLGGLMFLRRRWPVAVLIASVLPVLVLRFILLTDVGWIWPATVAYASAVLAGRLGWTTAVGAAHAALAWTLAWALPGGPTAQDFAAAGGEVLWLVAVLAASDAVRNWRRWRDEVVARLQLADRERELEHGRRRAEERMRIARELHDVVAHTLAVVGVQLNVAADAMDSDPDEARAALRLAKQVRGKAMADLGSLVTLLREGEEGPDAVPPPQADLAGIADLVAHVRAAGLVATLEESGDAAAIPAPVALAVHRVVQEALTNTVRHAGASRVEVGLWYETERVRLLVVDDGCGPGGETRDGHGLAGMRERVAALGGSLATGAGGDNGYVVEATIPTGRRS